MKRFAITLVVIILASFGVSFSLKAEGSPILKILKQSEGAVFQPLDWIEITGAEKGVDIRIRDPFIYADQESKTYFMYAQSANRADSDFTGVEVYSSNDLKNWTPPSPVLILPDDAGIKAVCAPEMHPYNGLYYLFVTLTYQDTLPENRPVEEDSWPSLNIRGTHLFHADSPLGPFQQFKSSSHTPEGWMALDGTLFTGEGKPYMIFCHEWVQLIDGTMDIKKEIDLS